jgi:hypothetical protein
MGNSMYNSGLRDINGDQMMSNMHHQTHKRPGTDEVDILKSFKNFTIKKKDSHVRFRKKDSLIDLVKPYISSKPIQPKVPIHLS